MPVHLTCAFYLSGSLQLSLHRFAFDPLRPSHAFRLECLQVAQCVKLVEQIGQWRRDMSLKSQASLGCTGPKSSRKASLTAHQQHNYYY